MKSISLKQDGRLYYGWLVVFLGFLLMTFAYVGFVSLTSVFVLPVTEEMGFERGDFMTYLVLLSLTCIVSSPFIGKKMVKGKNIKLYLTAACLVGAIGYFGFSRSNNLSSFYIFAILLGLGFAGTAPMPVSLMINCWFGGKVRGTATGFAFIGSGLGGMILAPVLNAVIQSNGWRAGYMTLSVIFLILIIPVLLIANVSPESKGFKRMGETDSEAKDTNAVKSGLTLGEAKNRPEFWLAFISVILVVFGSSALLANSVSFFVGCGIDTAKAASFHGLMLGSLILGKPLMGAFIDKFGIRVGAVVTCFIFACTFVSLFFMPASPWILVYGVILCYCFGGPTITIVPPLMVNGLFGERDYGTIVGIMNTATSIGGAFGGTIAAKVYDATGSYTSFWAVAIAGICCAAVFRMIAFSLNKKHKFA